MRFRGAWLPFAIVILIGVALTAGCGGGSSHSSVLTAKLNALCRQEKSLLAERLPLPTAAVEKALAGGHVSPAAASYLGTLATTWLSVTGRLMQEVGSWKVPASDRVDLEDYKSVTRREAAALRQVRNAERRKDLSAVRAAWTRFQQASQANSDLNAKMNATECGTLSSPAFRI